MAELWLGPTTADQSGHIPVVSLLCAQLLHRPVFTILDFVCLATVWATAALNTTLLYFVVPNMSLVCVCLGVYIAQVCRGSWLTK